MSDPHVLPPGGHGPEPAAALVLGEGLLAETIAAAVSPGRQPATGAPVGTRPSLTVAASDSWAADDDERTWCREKGIPLLQVRTEWHSVVIGPLETPGRPGCARCARERRDRAREDSTGRAAMWATHGVELTQQSSPLLTTLAGRTVAALVAAEVERAHGSGEPRTASALLHLDLGTLTVTRHGFLPDPRCPDCGGGTAPDAREGLGLTPRPKVSPDTYRAHPQAEPRTLVERYVDPEVGLVRELQYGTSGGLALARAPMGLRDRRRSGSITESGYGRTRAYRTSELVAICEALERYGGLRQGDEPESVRASYTDISDRAVDMSALGTYPPESFDLPGFICAPFDPEREYTWMTGHSFARGGPVLVPECLAYYAAPPPGSGRPYFVDSSNGAAVGGCLEEAVLHAILELAERDAFLLTWHARMGVPELDPGTAEDRSIPLLVNEIERETGYRVHIFDITADHGVPCVWTMAVRPDDGTRRPKTCSTAGAHPIPERAVGNALAELGAILNGLIERYPGESDLASRMVDDPWLVREMEDHVLLYGDDRAFSRFDFLFGGGERKPLGTLGAGHPRIRGDDLTQDLYTLVQRFLDLGLDVVAVDQTTSEHRAGGLSCAKVIIPGTVPLTFGHAYRRLDGLPRLLEASARLGYSPRPLRVEELNTAPHPFP